MTSPEQTAITCWSCGASIAAEDRYCRYCGKGQGKRIPWYYGHSGIIVLTMLVMGPFSLFLVWKSPLLTKPAKWAYTAVILVFSWYFCLTLYKIWQTFIAVFSMALPV